MKELSKANVTGTEVTPLGLCVCVAICLIFTTKRHEDVLSANAAVKN